MTANVPRLEIENLACGRGERALFEGLSFGLGSGEAARVLGDNGRGKTTFLRTVAGLHAPLAGRVRWLPAADGPDDDETRLCDQLCFVGHDNALNAALTPVENLEVLMRLSGRPSTRERIAEQLDALGLARAAGRLCARLSAGQRRRVSLARLWLTDAPLWLLDEPASALDVDARAALARRIAAHVGAGGIVVFTTHEQLVLPGVTPKAIELPAC